MIHAIFLLLRQIPFSAMLLSHSKKGPSEHPAFPLLWATKSLSLHRSGVIFLFICHLTLFPVFLQACPFVTRCVWVMHHTGRCQTFPSGPLLHWSALREPRIHLDLLTCFCAYVCSIYLYILDYILYLSIHGRVCVCAPVCIYVFILHNSRALPTVVELVISRSGWRAMEAKSTDVTSLPGWVLTENNTAFPLSETLHSKLYEL